jgi:hypothetical protein
MKFKSSHVSTAWLLPAILLMFTCPPARPQDAAPQPAQSTVDPASSRPQPGERQPLTAEERLTWFAKSTGGFPSLAGGVISSAWGTEFNSPRDYGVHWEGFGKRYGMRLTGVSVGNAIEAGLGAALGDDPRYFSAQGQPFGRRVLHIVKFTFISYKADGSTGPNYSFYAADVGNNFLSNLWRAPSESDAQHAVIRIGEGLLGRMASNAFNEFWPDVKQRLRHKK